MILAGAKLARFPGGLRLPGHKAESTSLAVTVAKLPTRLVLPLHQHIGAPAKPLVSTGERVLKGQMIAKPAGFVSAPIHASTSGLVLDIGDYPVPHPSGLHAPCIVIEADGLDAWIPHHAVENYQQLNPSALRNIIREAGIVGMGGAGFPTFIKLNRHADTTINTLILNGVECEPYITCDDMLMRERPEEIIAGMLIMRHALQAGRCLIGIEDNKPDAIARLSQVITDWRLKDVEVVAVPTRYPAGGAKQLVKVLTGLEVPRNTLSSQLGVVCHNVATATAVYRAIMLGEPSISRTVTVTGHGIKQPRNLEVLFGTPMRELVEHCGSQVNNGRFLMGGPMMGFPIHDLAAPVIKTTNCILSQPPLVPKPVLPCIRCGACADACPVSLLPQQLYWHARAREFDKAQEYKLFDCIECGCCTEVCPSNIPLVDYYRFAKTEIATQEREKQKASVARNRHEFRLQRLDREKSERAARHDLKKAALNVSQAGSAPEDSAGVAATNSTVQAAIDRAQAKRSDN